MKIFSYSVDKLAKVSILGIGPLKLFSCKPLLIL